MKHVIKILKGKRWREDVLLKSSIHTRDFFKEHFPEKYTDVIKEHDEEIRERSTIIEEIDSAIKRLRDS